MYAIRSYYGLQTRSFDGKERLMRAVRAATLADVVRAYETLVLGPGGTRAIIQIQGTRLSCMTPAATAMSQHTSSRSLWRP